MTIFFLVFHRTLCGEKLEKIWTLNVYTIRDFSLGKIMWYRKVAEWCAWLATLYTYIWLCTLSTCAKIGYRIYPKYSDNLTLFYSCSLIWTCTYYYLGPVVQSVVSLTSSLRVISLTVLTDSIYNILFFAEKMWVAFALQKLLTFFQQKISAYLRITRCKF